jgi:hypothetical protein
MKRRGLIALFAGSFIVLLVGAVWIWVDRLVAGGTAVADPSDLQVLGKLNAAFPLILVAGILVIANGWLMLRTGKSNSALAWAVIVVFLVGAFIGFGASR